MKENELLIPSTTGITLKTIMLSVRSQIHSPPSQKYTMNHFIFLKLLEIQTNLYQQEDLWLPGRQQVSVSGTLKVHDLFFILIVAIVAQTDFKTYQICEI